MVADLWHIIQQRLETIDLVVPGTILVTALACAMIAYWRTAEKISLREFFDFAFPAEVILHPSARADALFWVTRRMIMPFLFIPAGAAFVAGVGYATHQVVGALLHLGAHPAGPAGPATIVLFTISMLLAYDVSYYLYHVAQHRFPVLWELHKVHHSAEVMVGITKDRVHPLDTLMNRLWDAVIPGICFGLWSLVALDPVEVAVFGVNVYVVRNILMMDFVRHTHFKISFGPINHLVICPHWHQLHHSVDPRHYDKNFGLLFPFWDRIFGTLVVPEPGEDFRFGLVDRDVRDYQSLSGLYILPLRKMGGHIARAYRRRWGRSTETRDGGI